MNNDAIIRITMYIREHYPNFSVGDNCNGYPLYVPGECEHYGFNEMGGKGPDGEDHCHQYEDKDGPLAII